MAPVKALVDRFEELSMKLGEDLPEDQMNKVIDEQGRVQDQIDAADAWDVDRAVEVAMDALRLPPGDADVTKLSGGERRRVALCHLLLQPRTCFSSTSPPTTSMPNRWRGSSAS